MLLLATGAPYIYWIFIRYVGMQNRTITSIFKPSNFEPSKWTLMFLLLSSMLILMGGAAVAPALPLITEAFPDSSEALVSLIITLPSLAIVFAGFFIGSLSDRIGRLPVLCASLIIFSIAGVSAFFLNSIIAILIGRFILGVGIAGITISTSALITGYYSGITRNKVLGYQAASMGAGVLVLETTGGILAGISWRMAFLIYLIGLFILAGVMLFLREPSRESKTSSDLKSDNLKNTKNKVDDKNKKIAFDTPVLTIAMIYLTIFIGMMMFFLVPTKFPYYLSDVLLSTGLLESGGFFSSPAVLSGILLGLLGLFSSAIGIVYWRISKRMNRISILVISYLMFCVSFLIFGYTNSILCASIAVILVGVGNGLVMPTVLQWLMSITPGRIVGKVMGGFSVALNMGIFVSPLIAVPILSFAGSYAKLFGYFSILAALLAFFYFVFYLKMSMKLDFVHSFMKVTKKL